MDLGYNQRDNFSWSKVFPGVKDTHGDPLLSTVTRKRSIDEIKNKTLMANLYITPIQWWRLTPYVNGGMGIAWNSMGTMESFNYKTKKSAFLLGDDNTSFAWQVGAGVNLDITENFYANLSYRFLDMGKFVGASRDTFISGGEQFNQAISPVVAEHVYTNEIFAGLNYEFCL